MTLTASAFLLDYQYIQGDREYFIDSHCIRDRFLPFSVAVSVFEGEYFVGFDDGHTVCVKPGETVFVPSFVKHAVWMERRGKLSHAHFLCRYATVDLFALTGVKFLVAENAEIQCIISALNDAVYPDVLLQKMYTDKLLCSLFLTLFDEGLIPRMTVELEPWLNTALRYIHENLHKGVTVEEAITVSGCGKTVFYRVFMERLKVTPHAYIEAERFRLASMLLLKGNKVKEAAKAVGIQDVSYFNKVFKRKFGMTPLEHKQKMIIYSKGEIQ